MSILCTVLFLCFHLIASYQYYNVGVLMASHLDSPFDLERCGPAVDMALEEINAKFLEQHGIKLAKVQGSYPSCSGARAPGLAADMHFKSDVIAFIGPACLFALEPVARLAAYWNTPIITGMGDQPPSDGELSVTSGILGRLQKWNRSDSAGILKDKSKYSTLTRMSYCQCRLKSVFASIFRQFGWKHIALILDRSDLFSLTAGKNLEHGLKKEGLLTFIRELDGNDNDSIDNYLRDASMYARVVILSVRGTLVRKFMLSAHALGMTTGEWTFLDVEIFQGSYWKDHDWEAGDDLDLTAKKAYEALLRVSLLTPTTDKFQDFADRVKERALVDYNYNISENEELNFVIGAFYDGVYLLGMALNETLHDDGNIRDGINITARMWSRDFNGITGHVRIDNNGDRDADYSVLDLDPGSGKFEVVAHYYGVHKEYVPVAGKVIHWPGARKQPPPDVPKCGFIDHQCREPETISILFIYGSLFLGISLLVVLIISCIFNKKLRAHDIHNMSWRLRSEEVHIEGHYTKGLSNLKTGLRPSSPGGITMTMGIYRANRVAIKKIPKRKIDLNKRFLLEMKQVRDITHENTVRFIGACIECPVIMLLTEYCQRGSLKEVLENEAIPLDWNFRMSLIHDLVKGMCYLHNSEIAVHGKLHSGNCLIDSRFVLKIADFGLSCITTFQELCHGSNYYLRLLWIAPELLPSTIALGSGSISQKGDVYSFGIILEEIIVRGGPFEHARSFLAAEEIIARVASSEAPPFRPTVQSADCPESLIELMERSWNENCEDRPNFESIKLVFRNIMKGFCENIMDDLLRRMEQYANNLEALVSEKTEQLSMEKKRSETLLYQVLPVPVAQQLMSGEMVQPEQFESVTIYFSDIVGFTSLCANSTPMQVVDFLNDLYSTFDRIIGHYDVYKVETIGDAYMVVSGLPARNGDLHVREIALLSLTILKAVKSFTIKHSPELQLKVRIGIHTGPVCAGVVGQRMPHYCLFGDTVNTASRMESTGLPLKIHVSSETKKNLDKFGTFRLELRGKTEVKGKGPLTTYWLVGTSENVTKLLSPVLSTPDLDSNPYPLVFMGNSEFLG